MFTAALKCFDRDGDLGVFAELGRIGVLAIVDGGDGEAMVEP